MALTYETVTFPVSVNSVPFYPATSMRRSLDAVANFGQARYLDTLTNWQTPLQYLNKRLFNDYITVQFKTQANYVLFANRDPDTGIVDYAYVNPAKLYVYTAKQGADGTPVPDARIAGFTALLDPAITAVPADSQFWGMQALPVDVYTNPISGGQTPLVSYMWQFKFEDVLSHTTAGGVYFLRFDNVDLDGGVQTWYSEPILVYGDDAAIYCPETLEFEATNATNITDFIVDGWLTHFGKPAIATTRVEADILEYDPKGIYIGYLQQQWLASTTYRKSWKTFTLNIGSVSEGVPATMFEIMTRFMEMDTIVINNQYYTYDIAAGGSGSPTNIWKVDKKRVNGLTGGTLPIRYKFENQFYVGNPITLFKIFDEVFDDTFA